MKDTKHDDPMFRAGYLVLTVLGVERLRIAGKDFVAGKNYRLGRDEVAALGGVPFLKTLVKIALEAYTDDGTLILKYAPEAAPEAQPQFRILPAVFREEIKS